MSDSIVDLTGPDHRAEAKEPWWTRFKDLEPALLRGIIGLLVSLGLVWGLDFTDLGEQLKETADILGSIVTLVVAWWTRGVVVPVKKAAAVQKPDGKIVAGPAGILREGQPVAVVPTRPHDGPVVAYND
jgi:hypothetical protein